MVRTGLLHILKRMKRSHTAQSYIRLIERLRAARPDLLLSGDFIVGFPEESEADFQATMDLIEEVKYGYAYSFKYSPRPGTPAAARPQLAEDVKDDRLKRLQALITKQQREVQDSMVGKTVSVLFEKPGRFAGQMVGKSEYLHAVHVQGADLPAGTLAKVRIDSSGANSLSGTVQDSL